MLLSNCCLRIPTLDPYHTGKKIILDPMSCIAPNLIGPDYNVSHWLLFYSDRKKNHWQEDEKKAWEGKCGSGSRKKEDTLHHKERETGPKKRGDWLVSQP